MIDLSITCLEDGLFGISFTREEDGVTIPLLDGTVNSVTIDHEVIEVATILEP